MLNKKVITYNIDSSLEEKILLHIHRVYTSQVDSIFVGVSWGVDSMTILFFLHKYLQQKDVQKKIYVLHYNHKQRAASEDDELFVKNFCDTHNFTHVCASYLWLQSDERHLRKARHAFFDTSISVLWKKTSVLMLWHHLNDRIETSILNLVRWCSDKWFYNMSTSKNWLKRDGMWNILQYVVFRPLIDITKQEIHALQKKYSIPYRLDHTNTDPTISKRNLLREYSEQLQTSNFEELFLHIYTSHNSIFPPKITPLKLFSPNIYEYYCVVKISSIRELVCLLDFINVYKNITTPLLQQLFLFLQDWVWLKRLQQRTFVKSHWSTYLILANNSFWSQDAVFANIWAPIQWKKPSKRYINEKIPFFLRNYVEQEMRPHHSTPPRRWMLEDAGFLLYNDFSHN